MHGKTVERKLINEHNKVVAVVRIPDTIPPIQAVSWKAGVFCYSPANCQYYESQVWIAEAWRLPNRAER